MPTAKPRVLIAADDQAATKAGEKLRALQYDVTLVRDVVAALQVVPGGPAFDLLVVTTADAAFSNNEAREFEKSVSVQVLWVPGGFTESKLPHFVETVRQRLE